MRLVFSQEASRPDEEDNQSFTAGSQERYESNLTATTPVHTHKYVDPFNPNSVIKPLSANQRRWVHTFPIGENSGTMTWFIIWQIKSTILCAI